MKPRFVSPRLCAGSVPVVSRAAYAELVTEVLRRAGCRPVFTSRWSRAAAQIAAYFPDLVGQV